MPAETVPAQTANSTDGNYCDYEDGDDPNNQLLTEHWAYDSSVQIPATDNVSAPPSASFDNQNKSFVQISAADTVYTVPDVVTSPLISPPQSSEDTSLPLESSENITRPGVHGHRRTRRTRTRVVDTVEEPRAIRNARKSRRKHNGQGLVM